MERSDEQVSGELKALYDSYYSGPSDWRWLGAIAKAANIIRLCQGRAHGTVLDIGCGEGAVLLRLSDLGFGSELYGLEISGSGVKATLERKIPRLTACALFDGYHIPYEDGRFDLAILSHVVEHLEYPERLLREASRVARLVFVEIPLEDNALAKLGIIPYGTGHLVYYSRKTLRALLARSDLTILGQTTVNSTYRQYLHLYGRKGSVVFLAKQLALLVVPPLATRLMTFNCATLCAPANPGAPHLPE
ncbi:MAG: class I SAM-dependent methyltransferase [Candidatus Hydrogenedentes bacterium]|nr:class I SAM-dependent methyltransferase [Candidatus Hydrogenedentota bacterium]